MTECAACQLGAAAQAGWPLGAADTWVLADPVTWTPGVSQVLHSPDGCPAAGADLPDARTVTVAGAVEHTCDEDASAQPCTQEACITSGMAYRHTALAGVQLVARCVRQVTDHLDRITDLAGYSRPSDTVDGNRICLIIRDVVAAVHDLPKTLAGSGINPQVWQPVTTTLFREAITGAFRRAATAVDDTGCGWLTARAMYDLQRHHPGIDRLGLVPVLDERDRRRLGDLVNVADATGDEVARALRMCPAGEYAVVVDNVRNALTSRGPEGWALLSQPAVVLPGGMRVPAVWWMPTALAEWTATRLAATVSDDGLRDRVRVLPLPRPDACPDLFAAFTALWRPNDTDSPLADAQVAFDAARSVALPASGR